MVMGKKKKRVDVSGNGDHDLADDRLSELQKLRDTLPSLPEDDRHDSPSVDRCGYSVSRTRAGRWPISLEKRMGNRVVTIIGSISGDAACLLSELRKRCGAGGTVRDHTIELQGDHRRAVEEHLDVVLRGRNA